MASMRCDMITLYLYLFCNVQVEMDLDFEVAICSVVSDMLDRLSDEDDPNDDSTGNLLLLPFFRSKA